MSDRLKEPVNSNDAPSPEEIQAETTRLTALGISYVLKLEVLGLITNIILIALLVYHIWRH